MDQKASESEPKLLVKQHVRFLKRTLGVLPSSCESLDTNRMTILFFAVSGLDLLGALDSISQEEKRAIVDWIYSQQVLPDKDCPGSAFDLGGFRGASFLGIPFDPSKRRAGVNNDCSHVAMTYTALATLLILGDDLSRVNREAVLQGIRKLQLEDGSFAATALGSESDMRFIYCACCVCYILNDWSPIDQDRAAQFILQSQSYECGIGQRPYLEAHGGSTFCAVASLILMNRLHSAFSPAQIEGLKLWCIRRQQTGFQGRPNKPTDTCYSFWIGATLHLLECTPWINKPWNRGFILSTQNNYVGGFAKWPDTHPDPLHTYLGLSALALSGDPEVLPVHATLNVSQRAMDWLHQLHDRTITSSHS